MKEMIRIRQTRALSNKYDQRLSVFICMKATKNRADVVDIQPLDIQKSEKFI